MVFSIKPLGGLFAAACILASIPLVVLPAAPVRAQSTAETAPRILSEEDTARYRQIFAYQEKRDWRRADRVIKKLSDKRLMGRVLYQRYMHPTGWRSSYKQLSSWMSNYADQPGAVRMWKLARHRKPNNTRALKRPIGPKGSVYGSPTPVVTYKTTKRLSRAQRNEKQNMAHHMLRHLLRGQGSHAAKHLKEERYLQLFDIVELDLMRGRVAAVLFRAGKSKTAYDLASTAANRSREHGAYADWVAGLSAWHLGDVAQAGHHFNAMTGIKNESERLIAGGAFWAARAALADRRPADVNRLLAIAAAHPRTFYGLIAARQLGTDTPFSWTLPPLENDTLAALMASPQVKRAVALTQVGETQWAAREIRRLFPSADAAGRLSLLGLAARIGVPSAEISLARAVLTDDGRAYDTALYPLPPWQPDDGFTVDRALVFAFIRQESAFNTHAKSKDGARGLMQLMPRTASFIGKDRSLRRNNKRSLFAPELNVKLGQDYLLHLMEDQSVSENLVMLAAAYNGGPGNLRKWSRNIKHRDDPLLFLESLPSLETRTFIRRVLGNFWIYRDRLGQKSPSLDAVAAGAWPAYTALDGVFDTAQASVREP